jgi:hypothetical protein
MIRGYLPFRFFGLPLLVFLKHFRFVDPGRSLWIFQEPLPKLVLGFVWLDVKVPPACFVV